MRAPHIKKNLKNSEVYKEIKMIKYVLAITLLAAGMVFAGKNQPSGPIAREVRHELVMLPYLDVFDNLSSVSRRGR